GLHLEDALPERPDDPPAADVGAEPHRDARGHLDPRRHREVGWVAPVVEDERESDHTHRLLRVVGAMVEGNPGARRDLPQTEAAIPGARRDPSEDPVEDE